MNSNGKACARWRENLALFAAEAVSEPEAQALKTHIAECAACRQYLGEIKSVAAPLAGWEKSFVDIEPTQATRERWRKALQAARQESGRLSNRERKNFVRAFWFELIWPARRTWAGLATVWVALAIFHFGQADRDKVAVAKSNPPAAEWRIVYAEQKRVLGEILGSSSAAAPVEPPRRNSNQPRSERRVQFLLV